LTSIDLFSGAGGFCLAARELGLDPLGIEWSDSACAIREAAGLRTLKADVAALDPHVVLLQHFNKAYAPNGITLDGLIGSPPCQAFSSAGKGEGRGAIDAYLGAIRAMGDGEPVDVAALDEASGDERGHLVLEPLRWALALMPRWIVLEQVPPVLPLWEAMAVVLRERGYSAATAILTAEAFGVPQTRRRAFLIASLDGPVAMPRPSHQRYIAPRRREEATESLFAVPEPERIVLAEDAGLLPWVSMAEALGWDGGAFRLARGEGMCDRHGERPDTPMSEPAPVISTKVRTASWVLRSGQSVAGEGRAERPASAPSLSVIGRFDLCRWVGERPSPTILGTRRSSEGMLVGKQMAPGEGRNVGGHGYVKPTGDPTSAERLLALMAELSDRCYSAVWLVTLDVDLWRIAHEGGGRYGEDEVTAAEAEALLSLAADAQAWWKWWDDDEIAEGPSAVDLREYEEWFVRRGDGTHNLPGCPLHEAIVGQRRNSGPGAEREPRDLDAPSYTVRAAGSGSHPSGVEWVTERPATTVNGDPRISEPGRHDPEVSGSQQANAVRVTLEEAACLQSFPPGYPWMAAGSKTAAFMAIGNACPPLLGWHVLGVVVDVAQHEREAA
jgi:DNA (cytosine-5)-methyltransferase 1